MFKCENCNKTTSSGEKQNKVTVETRAKDYLGTRKVFDEEGFYTFQKDQLLGSGTEIVKELSVCNDCNRGT